MMDSAKSVYVLGQSDEIKMGLIHKPHPNKGQVERKLLCEELKVSRSK